MYLYTFHMKSTRNLKSCIFGFDSYLKDGKQPDGFPWLAGKVVEELIDFTAGSLGEDFTGKQLPNLKSKIKRRGLKCCRSAEFTKLCFRFVYLIWELIQ